jgi:hypothetical protein
MKNVIGKIVFKYSILIMILSALTTFVVAMKSKLPSMFSQAFMLLSMIINLILLAWFLISVIKKYRK